ncbi:MAG: hypothetical protein PSU94_09270 [Lacunisphaera sp.]|nr:hypothetical protein [Lacunisphaera sp.]
MTTPALVQKLWNYCNILPPSPACYGEMCRDGGLSYGDYEEQTRIMAEVERRLSMVDELETFVQTNLRRATRHRQSVPQKALTGGLA